MNIVFAGTPEFAARALAALLEAGHHIPLVLTQPDRPAGRGMKMQISAVKTLAQQRGLAIYQPQRLKDPQSHAPIQAAGADLMVVAAYGLILPQAVLDLPARGCLNIHASLLPRWRGAAPIQRAIQAGDSETGITVMRMEAGLDTGPMLLSKSLAITPDDSAATLHDKLAKLGAELIVDALARLDDLNAVPQPESGVTYARKIEKTEAAIDWRRPAAEIDRQIRAFDPFPGAAAGMHGSSLKLWRALPGSGRAAPGLVLAAGPGGLDVACGEGVLRIVEAQRPGGKRLAVGEFLSGFAIKAGDFFTVPRD